MAFYLKKKKKKKKKKCHKSTITDFSIIQFAHLFVMEY